MRTVRDTHLACADRVHGLLRGPPAPAPGAGELLHRGIASAVYGGLGLGLRAASRGSRQGGRHRGVGPRLEDDPRGRFVNAAVNGLIGDRLVRERPRLAIRMAVRAGRTRRRPRAEEPLPRAFPDGHRPARGVPARPVRERVLLEPPARADRHDVRRGAGRARAGRRSSCAPTPASGLRENGVALAALLQPLVEAWPVDVTRIALVGHSMGGLIMRAAGAVATEDERPWTELVSDVVTLGTPHLGRPDRARHRPRQPRPGPAAGDRGVRPDPRLALGRRPRPRRRARRGRPAAAARPLPAGRGDPDRGRRATRSGTSSATYWCGCPRRTAGTGTAPSCSPGPTCSTSAGPTTSTCSTTPRSTARWRTGSAERHPSSTRQGSRWSALLVKPPRFHAGSVPWTRPVASWARTRRRCSPGVGLPRAGEPSPGPGPGVRSELGVGPGGAAVDADLDPRHRAPARPGPALEQRAAPARRTRVRVMKSGKPGRHQQRPRLDPGHRLARLVRVAASAGRRGSGSPRNGSSGRVIDASHLTCAMPYQPGTTSRTGKPCCGGSGAPFIS